MHQNSNHIPKANALQLLRSKMNKSYKYLLIFVTSSILLFFVYKVYKNKSHWYRKDNFCIEHDNRLQYRKQN